MKNTQIKSQDLVSVSLNTLISLAQKAVMLTLRRHQSKASQHGGYASRFKGRGMEFDESRIYQAGDDIRSIDWRVTARNDKPHTKIYREERERPIIIAIDYRTSMSFATRGVFKAVQAAKVAALLAWSAHAKGDRVGGHIFNDQGFQVLKAKGGKHAVLHFLNALVQPRYHTNDDASFEHALARLNHHLTPSSVIHIISDFRGLNAQAELNLAKIVRHCTVVLIHIYDPLESRLPKKGRYRLTDTIRDLVIDSRDKEALNIYRHQFQQRQEYLQQICKKWRMTLLQCRTTDDPSEVLR